VQFENRHVCQDAGGRGTCLQRDPKSSFSVSAPATYQDEQGVPNRVVVPSVDQDVVNRSERTFVRVQTQHIICGMSECGDRDWLSRSVSLVAHPVFMWRPV
jgi:hypothetical protein